MKRNNRVRATRESLGIAQRALAERVSLSRQSLSAIENGSAEPSVGIAVRIARALGRKVEELFAPEEDTSAEVRVEVAAVPFAARTSRVVLGHVDGRWVGHRLSGDESCHAADGVVDGSHARLFGDERDVPDTVLLAGCAPALAVLADRVVWSRGAQRAVWLDRSNATAMELLRAAHVSIAGVHGDPDASAAHAHGSLAALGDGDWVLVSLARWQAGLVVSAGNPLGIRDVGSCAADGVRVAMREKGAGARALFERELDRTGVPRKRLSARALSASSHLAVARAVAMGVADVGMAIEPVAVAMGLGFVPVAEERFDLVLARSSLTVPAIRRVLDVLASRPFRGDVGALGGYDVRDTGAVIARDASP